MTAAAAGEQAPAAERLANHPQLSRALILAGAGVLAAVNALGDQIVTAFGNAPLLVIADLADVSAILWFAMFAAVKIGWESDRDPLRRSDWLLVSIVVVCSVIPMSVLARAALATCALYALTTTKRGEPARRVALLLAALTGPLVWGPLILYFFAGPVLAFDAHIVAHSIGSSVDGNLVQFAHSPQAFLIGPGCSSIHNLSLAVILWCTAVTLFDLPLDGRTYAFGVAMMALMFAINIARLCAIGLFPGDFDFLHSGMGAALFSWTGFLAILIVAGLGTRNALHRAR